MQVANQLIENFPTPVKSSPKKERAFTFSSDHEKPKIIEPFPSPLNSTKYTTSRPQVPLSLRSPTPPKHTSRRPSDEKSVISVDPFGQRENALRVIVHYIRTPNQYKEILVTAQLYNNKDILKLSNGQAANWHTL